MPLSKPLYHIIPGKLWPENSAEEKKRLFELLVSLAAMQVLTVFHLLFNLLTKSFTCLVCDAGTVLVVFLAITCLINNKLNCVLNTLFTVPIFVYAYYIADFSTHPPLAETVYHSVGWLLTGAFFLFYFSESDFKIVLYSVLSLFTCTSYPKPIH